MPKVIFERFASLLVHPHRIRRKNLLSSSSVLMYAITPAIKTHTITGLWCTRNGRKAENGRRIKIQKREVREGKRERKIKRTNRIDDGEESQSMKFRAIWDRKSKERINGGRIERRVERCKSRHAGGRYESQDKSFHTTIEADFELPAQVGWLKR